MNVKHLLLFVFICNFSLIAYSQSLNKQTINTVWKFKKGEIPLAEYPQFDDKKWETVNIPHTWNAEDVLDEEDYYYRGPAWYRKNLRLNSTWKDKKVFIFFEAAYQETDVFVNGQFVGHHIGGYTAFAFDISKFLDFENLEKNTLAVRVNNRIHEDIPTLSADFTFFGGIYRDVYLLATNPVHFDFVQYANTGVYAKTTEVSAEKAELEIKSKIINESANNEKLEIVNTLYDKNFTPVVSGSSPIKLKAGEKLTDISNLTVKSPKLWSSESPNLYLLVSQLKKGDQIIAQVENQIGIRTFNFDTEKGFSMNGKPEKLIGVCRHQDRPGYGNALPDELHREDMRLLKEMGGNFFRISHYPQDPSILEACNSMGLLTSIEIPLVNTITESEAFFTNCKNMQTEMIHQNYNHPCLIIWCYMNELMLRPPKFEQPERYDQYYNEITRLTQELDDLTRQLDPTRYTMIANHGHYERYNKYKLTEIPQIVGWNLYWGWYNADFKGFDKFMDDFHKNHPDKHIIITEYGGGSDPRLRTETPERFDFSVEWQTMIHEHYLRAILDRDFVAGGSLWAFVDFQSESRIDAVPHINSKGVLTTDRKPKDSYYFYQSVLLNKPFIGITPAECDKMTGIAKRETDKSCTKKITIYSNLDEIELNHNNKTLGTKKVENNKAIFDVSFVNGCNLLEAVGNSDGKTIKQFKKVDFELQPANFMSDDFSEICINVGSHLDFTDNIGQIWIHDQKYTKGTYGYLAGTAYKRKANRGSYIGTNQDIMGTEDDPLYQTQLTEVSEYKIDVPNGQYEVTLYFAELLSDKEREKLAYNLGSDANDEKAIERIFDVFVNGQTIYSKLNIARQYGEERAINKRIIVNVKDSQGISINFEPYKGISVLNGIKVRKVH